MRRFGNFLGFVLLFHSLFLNNNLFSQDQITIYNMRASDVISDSDFFSVWECGTSSDAGNSTTWRRIGDNDRPCGSSGPMPRRTWHFELNEQEGYHIYVAGSDPNCDDTWTNPSDYIRYSRNMKARAVFHIPWALEKYDSSLSIDDFEEFTVEVRYGIPNINNSDYFSIFSQRQYSGEIEELFSTNQPTGDAGTDSYKVESLVFDIEAGHNPPNKVEFHFDTNYGTFSTAKEGPYIHDITLEGKLKPTPTLNLSTNSISFGGICLGSSDVKQYDLTGSDLTSNVTISTPSHFQISQNSTTGFSNSLTVSESGGSVNTTIYVKYTPGSTGTHTGNIMHASSGATTKNVSVSGTANSGPNKPGSISGSSNVCVSTNSAESYSISSVSEATSYQWEYTGGGGYDIEGSGTSIGVWFLGSGSGDLRVRASNECGTSSWSTKSITVASKPSRPASISGPTTVMLGNTETYSISSVSEADDYNWTYSGGGTPSGTGTSISLSPTSSGTLSVSAENDCGESSDRTLSIEVEEEEDPLLSVNPSSITLDSESGANDNFTVSSNISWNVSSNESWLDVSQTSGSDDGSVTVTATSANTSTNSRTATLTVSGEGQSETIQVTQAGLEITAPTVSTNNPSNISQTSITANGNITGTGGENSNTRGFEYGLTQTPTWSVDQSGSYGTGNYSMNVTDLTCNSTYWIRAFAENGAGIAHGSWVSFTTSDCSSDSYTLALNTNAASYGSVSGGGSYSEGTAVTITASPNTGYAFVNWTGDVSTITEGTTETEEITITMPAEDISLTANFESQEALPLPFEDGFEDGIDDWDVFDYDGDGNKWEQVSHDNAYAGDYAVRVEWNEEGNDDWLETPLLDLPSEISVVLSFQAKSHSENYPESFDVNVILEDGETVNEIASEVEVPDSYTQYSYDLSDYAGQKISVAIVCTSVDEYYLYVDEFSVKEGIVISVPDIERAETLVNVTPVPVREEAVVSIQGTDSNITGIELLNATGQLVKEYSLSGLASEEKISVSGQNTGVYFLRIYTGHGAFMKKIVIQ